MPDLHAVLDDLTQPLPDAIQQWHPACAISSYAVHHLALRQKVNLIAQVVHDILPRDAPFVIGDVAVVHGSRMRGAQDTVCVLNHRVLNHSHPERIDLNR